MALRPRPEAVRDNAPRFLSQPFDVAFGLMALLATVGTGKVLIQQYDALPHVGLLSLPLWLLSTWVILGLVGSVGMLTGVALGFWRSISRGLSATGNWFSLGVWLTVGITDALYEPTGIDRWGQYLAIALGCGMRVAFLARVEKGTDRAVEEKRRSDEDDA